MAAPKKLFLLDAMALIYRAYFAFSNNHRINSKGLNTSAIFGFTNTLLDVLKKEKPTHIAVVFDTAAPTSRHEEFAAYKANRQEIPEDLATAIPIVVKLCEAFNIPVIAMDGFEADDVIGTLARQAEKEGFETYMMTPDKDYGQLVDEHTFIYKPARAGGNAEVLGIAEICKRWEIDRVEQVIDILGLMGDSVDNIPGIPGVGEKTAIVLVKQFGSVENLLQNTEQLKGKLKEKVELNKAMAIQSKRLATIITDVPVKEKLDDLIAVSPNRDALRELFTELEFRRLAEQMGLTGTPVQEPEKISSAVPASSAPKKKAATSQGNLFDAEPEVLVEPEEVHPEGAIHQTIADVPHTYHLTDTPAKRAELLKQLTAQKQFCFDTETTGLDAYKSELVGMSFSWAAHEGYYVPVPTGFAEAQAIVDEFKGVFANESISKIAQNLKFDLSILRRYDVEIKGVLFDTMIAHFLIRPEMRHSMDVLAETYLNYAPVSIETLIGKKGKEQKNMRDIPVDQVAEYAAEDADVTYQLYETFAPKLKSTNTTKLFEEVEMPLVPVLAEMEAEGIKIDIKALRDFSAVLAGDIATTEAEIQGMAGTKFNVSSPKQVGEILFDVLKIVEKPAKTKTGQYSTAEDVLSKLENKHPMVRRILDYRELVKLKNTYVDVLPDLVNPVTGRIHTSYNQVVAVTGRLSSDNPNLQNIPIRTERGREIRKAFIPRNEEFTLLSADYSQIELRIIAELSGDPGMLEAFRSGEDIHAATASKVYNVPIKEVSGDMRRNAKMVNFGIIYGISAFGLADRLNISRTEAKSIIDNYFMQYSAVKEYMDMSIENARKKGFVETILGRRRYLRDINSANATVRGFAERNAINAPIQGSAADMIKIAMIRIHHEMKKQKMKSKMLLQVHDELVFDAHHSELENLKSLVENHMKNALPLKVPVEVGVGSGKNWLEAH
ncbi:MAG: DNA polymerase I [Bacteroidetes bacterium]|nr:DNA polymerase I [Bacteroidota bacterium]MBK9543468.1 DNA polymerase I [Bacteroidota bacterium]MBP6401691.1 DNA polymerase I [Bacteroidia bacterium]